MAYSLQPKKMLALNLLELLRKYSDENHRLSQQELLRLLESEYGMTADRKSVRRNLLELQSSGYPVCCDERPRAGADGEDGTFCTGWYIEHEFTDAELRLLIDSLISSRSLPQSQCAGLVRKIEELGSVHFRSRLGHVRALPGALPRSDQFFYTVELLDEAITAKKQVSFAYCEYGVDKKPHPRLDSSGNVRRYVVNPYQMVVANGRYYLICNYDKYDTLANYRIDRDVYKRQAYRSPIKACTFPSRTAAAAAMAVVLLPVRESLMTHLRRPSPSACRYRTRQALLFLFPLCRKERNPTDENNRRSRN